MHEGVVSQRNVQVSCVLKVNRPVSHWSLVCLSAGLCVFTREQLDSLPMQVCLHHEAANSGSLGGWRCDHAIV